MPFAPAPGVVRTEMLYNLNGEIVQNVYHTMDWEGPVSLAELEVLANIFKDWENVTAKLQRSGECSLTQIICTDLSSLDGAQFALAVSPPIVGNLPGDAMPGNCTWAVKLATSRGTRGSQGRTFWVGLADSQTDGNNIVQVNATAIVAALNTLRTTLLNNAAVGALAVLHGQQNGVPLNPREPTPVVTAVARDNVLDSQKSRLPGKRRKSRATP